MGNKINDIYFVWDKIDERWVAFKSIKSAKLAQLHPDTDKFWEKSIVIDPDNAIIPKKTKKTNLIQVSFNFVKGAPGYKTCPCGVGIIPIKRC